MLPVTNSRRTHRKTKTGCVICKRRKVKCDEARPSCQNCINYGENCEYASTRSTNVAPSVPTTSNTLRNPSASNSPQVLHESIHGSPPTVNGILPGAADPNLHDLELLHHFYTSTYATIHQDRALKTLWRTNVAHIAFKHDFVMHSILAFSALHLAYLTPSKRLWYISQAMCHHQRGLTIATTAMYQVTEQNSTPSTQDSTPLFLFSVLTCIFALAQPRQQDDFILVGEAGMSEWLVLLRGCSSIIGAAEASLYAGPLGPLFKAGRRREDLRENVCLERDSIEVYERLKVLERRINNSIIPFHELEVYNLSLQQLQIPLALIYGQGMETYEPGDVFVWVFRVPREFLLLLKEHKQAALTIFSFFAVIVKPLDKNWWMEGLSKHLISTIYPLIDDEHRSWIQWPLEEVGWTPPESSPVLQKGIPEIATTSNSIDPLLGNYAQSQEYLRGHVR